MKTNLVWYLRSTQSLADPNPKASLKLIPGGGTHVAGTGIDNNTLRGKRLDLRDRSPEGRGAMQLLVRWEDRPAKHEEAP